MKVRTYSDGKKNLPTLSSRGRSLILTRGCGPSLSSPALSPSLSQVHADTVFEASAEHEVGVALDGVAEGWVVVERKVPLPPPPRRVARGIRLLHQGGDLLLHHGCLISSLPSWPISSPSPSARAPPSGPPSSAASSCSSKLPSARGATLSLSHHSSSYSSTA
jgi:hypothetical protein